jgi:hypothetical protein
VLQIICDSGRHIVMEKANIHGTQPDPKQDSYKISVPFKTIRRTKSTSLLQHGPRLLSTSRDAAFFKKKKSNISSLLLDVIDHELPFYDGAEMSIEVTESRKSQMLARSCHWGPVTGLVLEDQ